MMMNLKLLLKKIKKPKKKIILLDEESDDEVQNVKVAKPKVNNNNFIPQMVRFI